MKKYVFLTAAALILSLSLAGCSGGTKKADTPADTATTDETVNIHQYDENFTDADKDIDMDAIDGKKAKTADDSEAKGEINGTEVKIEDAKVVDYNDGKAIIVSYKFTNNTASDVTFDGLLKTDANQGDTYLTTSLTLRMEGYVPETFIQTVGSGDTITTQRAYNLHDETTPVTITVENAANPDDNARVIKTFNID